MKTSLAFETAAADMFNNLDEVMNQLETLDNAIALLHQIGQVHKASGFPLDYFKVRPSAASLVPVMGMGGRVGVLVQGRIQGGGGVLGVRTPPPPILRDPQTS